MDPTLEGVLTIGGAGTVTTIIVEVLARALGPGFDKARFGPLLAIAIAIAVVLGAGAALGLAATADIAQGILTGVIAGAAAMGIHDFATGPVNKTLSG